MAWTTIGYHAFEQRCFDELTLQDCAGNYHMDISPMRWSASPLSAISYTRKEAARKLGATLTDSHEATPVKGKGLNHVVASWTSHWSPQTMWFGACKHRRTLLSRLPKASSSRSMSTRALTCTSRSQPFVPLALPGKWKVDLVWLGLQHNTNLKYILNLCINCLTISIMYIRLIIFYNIGSEKVASGWFSACQMHALGLQASSRAFQYLTAWLFGSKEKDLPCTYYLAMPPECLPLKELLHVKPRFSPAQAAPAEWAGRRHESALAELLQLDRWLHWSAIGCQPYHSNDLGASLLTSHCNPLVVKRQIACTCCALAPKICWTHFLHIQARCVPFGLSIPLALIRMIENQEVGLVVSTFKMKVSLTAKYQTQMDLVEHHEKMRLQGRKRRLEDDVARLEAELCERKAEVEQVAKKLCRCLSQ